MRLLIQWTLKEPANWVPLDSSAWASLPKLREPPPGKTGDKNVKPGWVYDLNVQGVRFSGNDHYAVEETGGGAIRVTVWNDDPDDWPEGSKYARVWTLLPLAPDDKLGGAINTKQVQILYAQDAAKFPTALPWEDFFPIRNALLAAGLERHGVWVSDPKSEELLAAQEPWGWRHWVDHLSEGESDPDPSVLAPDRRRLKQQRPLGRYRKPKGTRTYFGRSDLRGTGIHLAIEENAFETSAGPGDSETVLVPKAEGKMAFAFTTPNTEPGSADWPDGSPEPYEVKLDVSTAEADIDYGLLDLPGAVGHFARVNSSLTTDLETHPQAEGFFEGTGIKTATYTGTWAAGNATDRFEALVAARNTNAHMDESFGLTFDADASASGPWTAVGGDVTGAAILTGAATVNARARLLAQAKAVVTGAATIIALASTIIVGQASIEGAATVAAAGRVDHQARAVVTGAATVAPAGRIEREAKASIEGAATVAARATNEVHARAVVEGAATLSASGTTGTVITGAAILEGAATVTARAALTAHAQASLEGAATLSAIGTVQGVQEGAAVMEGAATVAARAELTAHARASIQGAATVAARAELTIAAKSAITGAATVLARPAGITRSAAVTIIGAASISAVGTLIIGEVGEAEEGFSVPGRPQGFKMVRAQGFVTRKRKPGFETVRPQGFGTRKRKPGFDT